MQHATMFIQSHVMHGNGNTTTMKETIAAVASVANSQGEGLCQMSWVLFSGYDYQNVMPFINLCSICYPSRVVHVNITQWLYCCCCCCFRPSWTTPLTCYQKQRYHNDPKNGCKSTVQKWNWGVPAPLKPPHAIVTYRVTTHLSSYSSFTFLTFFGLALVVMSYFNCIFIG